MAEPAKKDGGIHAGHRERIRERLRSEGLSGVSEHEVLELLLTYVIPHKDVNPLAHELIAQFGSLANVLEADERELLQVTGIGIKAASLLTLIPQLLKYYQLNAMGEKPVIENLAQARAYCEALFLGAHEERVYMLCLDQGGHVLHPALLTKGTLDEVTLYPRDLVSTAMRYRAFAVLLAHNHPGGIPYPSQADYDATRMAIGALGTISVRVMDHIIFSGGDIYSISQHTQMGDEFLGNLSYKARSTRLPGTPGKLRAASDGELIALTLDDLETRGDAP